jgi:arylsulfatase A-like enzyme
VNRTPDPSRRLPPLAIVSLGLWLGLLAGLAEVAAFGAKHLVLHRIIHESRDVVWMAPLADVALIGGLALVLAALGGFWGALRRDRTAIAVLASAACITVLLQYRPIYLLAKLVVAIGLGVRLAAFATARPGRLAAFARWTGGWLGGWAPGPRVAPPDLDRRALIAGVGTSLLALTGGSLGVQRWLEWRRAAARGAPPPKGRPNLLVIVLDTVSANHLGFLGYERDTMPFLARLAKRGASFSRAYSTAPWTLPGHASLFTGLWYHQLHVGWQSPLGSGPRTLAEVLTRDGYESAAFVGNTAFVSYEFGLNRGFVHFEDYDRGPGQVLVSSSLGSMLGCGNTNEAGCALRPWLGYYQVPGRKPAAEISREFLRWVDHRSDERPFFAFLNYFDAHAPYLPREPFPDADAPIGDRGNPMHMEWPDWTWSPDQVRLERNAYDGMLVELDRELARLFGRLAARGLLDDTLVVLTADHGEEFNEHGVMTHANSVYAPALHVPLLFVAPTRVPAGRRVDAPVSLRDVPATILECLGLPGALPGRSLAPWWRREPGPGGPLYSRLKDRPWLGPENPESRAQYDGIVAGRYHYILQPDGRHEVYDLVVDPWERRDLAGTIPADTLAAWNREVLRTRSRP